MTENEAISRIKDHMEIHRLKEPRAIYITVALSMAITALKEIQLYKDGKLCLVPEDVYSKQCCELDAYKEIGTVEECREAAEKQKKKTPVYEGDGYTDGYMVYDTWVCTNCGTKYEVDYDDFDFCPKCGQAINWEESEE